ncbi:MAG: hypothetical protein M3Z28_04695 [Candidatus Dormibacteraeota bacterium]|nr:hypothetical protein [Candidatus Dormibacteraeota bacterium]
MKTKLAIGVPSLSVDRDASATTLSGTLPELGVTIRLTAGAWSTNGVGVGVVFGVPPFGGGAIGRLVGAGVDVGGFLSEVFGNVGAPGLGEGVGSAEGTRGVSTSNAPTVLAAAL